MKALSIKQPWASLIAHGIKDIENRTWKTNFRGRIFIHASGKFAWRSSEGILSEEQVKAAKNLSGEIPISAIIGEVDIIDCVINHPSIWAEKTEGVMVGNRFYIDKSIKKQTYNWVLANAVLYDKPILEVKGKLSFWETDYHHCEDCNSVNHISSMSLVDGCWTCKKCCDELVDEYYNKLANE